MKGNIYNILKARFLVNEDATKNWRFIVFLLLLAIIMIANTHSYEKKIFEIADFGLVGDLFQIIPELEKAL